MAPAPRPLTSADVEAAAQVIAQAFIDDPLTAFMLPRRETRLGTLLKFFRAYGAASIKNGRGYGAGEPLAGVAYWKLPAEEDLSVSLGALGAFLPLLFSAYPLGYYRARPILRQIDELHARHAGGSHFYLDNLGVLASARGQGLASALIRPFLEMADAQGVSAYTDTVTDANVPLYEHFGFQCVEEERLPSTGVTVFALLRPHQA